MLKEEEIIIVSGLPRSGTSMMMQILQAGGMMLVHDNRRPADSFNPHGYFELDKVKKLQNDSLWLAECSGMVVKILFHLLKFLPDNLRYKIIFLQRNLDDVIASQNRMLTGYGKMRQDDAYIYDIMKKELNEVKKWLKSMKNMTTLFINYEEICADPGNGVQIIKEFLLLNLDLDAMQKAVKV